MITSVIKFIKVLSANGNPKQLAGAVALGMILGLTPFWSLHNLLVLFILCLVRLNISFFVISFSFFSGVAWMADPLFNQLGEAILTHPSLESFWTGLYQIDGWRLAHFNNTLTMGSLVTSLILFLPVLIIANTVIKAYRETVIAWLQKTRLMKALKASKWYQRAAKAYEISEAV